MSDTKKFLKEWINDASTDNKTKEWLNEWVNILSRNKERKIHLYETITNKALSTLCIGK